MRGESNRIESPERQKPHPIRPEREPPARADEAVVGREEKRRRSTYRQQPLTAQQWRVEEQMVPGHCSASAK